MSKHSESDEAYFCQLVIGALRPDEDMTFAMRAWCLLVGIPGMIVADPVMFIFNKLGISDSKPSYDVSDGADPNNPFNQNY